MRVIAGQFKGHRLFTPADNTTRPTTDRTREFLFSYLDNLTVDARVLDLFAGTGSVGIEAMSRSAASVTFVEISRKSCELIKKNLQKTGITAPVITGSETAFLKRAIENNWQYDIIFCDPPYEYNRFAEVLTMIKKGNLLGSDGLVIYESSMRNGTIQSLDYTIIKEKKLGDTKLTIYKMNE